MTPIKWTTPINLAAHQAEIALRLVARDESPYTGAFEYLPFDLECIEEDARSFMSRLNEVPEDVRGMVAEKVDNAVERSRTIHSRNDADFSAWEELHNGLPNQLVFDHAQSIVDKSSNLRDPVSGSIRIDTSRAIRAALDNYGLDRWTVVIEPNMASDASVNGLTRTIRVRQEVPQQFSQVRRLVVHEIGGHVLRWENAWRQPSDWLAFPFGNSVATEEGLAALLEEELSVSTADTMPKYAMRVLAVAASRSRNMMELARDLHHRLHMSPAGAAALTLRVRRGLTRPDSLGGSTKDHEYLSGLLALRGLNHDDRQVLRSTNLVLS